MLASGSDCLDVAQSFGNSGLAEIALAPTNDESGQNHDVEPGVGTGDRALPVGNDNRIDALLPGLDVGQLQSGIGCTLNACSVPQPLVTERWAAAGNDTEEDINALCDGLALGLAGNGRRPKHGERGVGAEGPPSRIGNGYTVVSRLAALHIGKVQIGTCCPGNIGSVKTPLN